VAGWHGHGRRTAVTCLFVQTPAGATPMCLESGVMTVAVVVKVYDGLVVATDSATTMPLTNGGAQVYNGANKIFHLHRDLPVACLTWGLGNIGDASISTLAKDLRGRLMGRDPTWPDWQLDPDSYTVEEIANRVLEMFYDDLYVTEFGGRPPVPGASLGLLVAGYSANARQAEVWKIIMSDPKVRPSAELEAGPTEAGWKSYAQPEATERLFNGHDSALRADLQAVLEPQQWAKAEPVLASRVREPAIPPMPFADAISLARFLVDVTVGYSRYLLGPDTVGGTVEVAGINRHEGFKWISRKHYYSPDVNPREPGHAH
jgi:hypothetical protein